MLQYLETVLEKAFFQLIGLTEAGAETPYEEAAAFVGQFLEQAAVDESGGASLGQVTYSVVTKATYEIDVPGAPDVAVLSSEGG